MYKNVRSTNIILREKVSTGAREGLVVVSASQSEGYGRFGRKFYSPEDTGVYMSLLLKPNIDAWKATYVTTMAAVAICRAVESAFPEIELSIKWVNDIFLNNRKVCGILTEASLNVESRKMDYVILGIGINVYPPKNGFPKEIHKTAGALFDRKKQDIRNKVVAGVLNCFSKYYTQIENDDFCKNFIEEYKRRCFVIGRKIKVISGDSEREALAVDIDQNCCLKVQYPDGTYDTVSSGEISIKPD